MNVAGESQSLHPSYLVIIYQIFKLPQSQLLDTSYNILTNQPTQIAILTVTNVKIYYKVNEVKSSLLKAIYGT